MVYESVDHCPYSAAPTGGGGVGLGPGSELLVDVPPPQPIKVQSAKNKLVCQRVFIILTLISAATSPWNGQGCLVKWLAGYLVKWLTD